MGNALVRWRGVHKRYAHFTLHNMTLELAEAPSLALQARKTSFV